MSLQKPAEVTDKMAKQCTILDVENLRILFNKVMQLHHLKPEDVKKDKSKVNISDRGQFDCITCHRIWNSNFSWVKFDLIETKITYRWRMKCRVCLNLCEPTFSVDQLERMYEKAVVW